MSNCLTARLWFPCPDGCDSKTPKYWCHANCGGNIYMNERGDLWCVDHSYLKSFIKEWSFRCNSYNHKGGYKEWEGCQFLAALG